MTAEGRTMKDWIVSRAIALALPLIVGPIAFLLTQWLKRSIGALDKAKPAVKQAVVLVISFVLAGVAKFAGPYLPAGCDASADAVACLDALTDPQAMQVIVSALFAYALHASAK